VDVAGTKRSYLSRCDVEQFGSNPWLGSAFNEILYYTFIG